MCARTHHAVRFLLHTLVRYLTRSHLQLPAQDKPFRHLGWVRRRVSAKQGLVTNGTLRISHQHPTDDDERFARAVPDGDLGGEFHGAGGAVVPRHGGDGPRNVSLIQEGFQRRSPTPLAQERKRIDKRR